MLQEQLTLPIGAIIQDHSGERYIIKDILGQGGFSAVYLVRERRSKHKYFALKEMIDPNKQERGQLTSEAGLLRRLTHRSLPHVYQVFEDTQINRIYMLMDYIQGKDLEVLRREQSGKRFSVALTLTLLAPIADALNYLHKQVVPIVHRDVKPSNIIVPLGTGDAVLVDFGLAKEYIEDKTTSIFRFGTPGYAAPEQYGQGTNPRTDIYALGATLYTLLTGNVPTDALTRMMAPQTNDPLVPAHTISSAISLSVSNVIAKSMALRLENRYATIDEFWQALSIAVVQPETGPMNTALTVKQPTLSPADLTILTTTRHYQPGERAAEREKTAASISRGGRQLRGYRYRRQPSTRMKVLISLLTLIIIGVIVDASLFWNIQMHTQAQAQAQRRSTQNGQLRPRPDPHNSNDPHIACQLPIEIINRNSSYLTLTHCYAGTIKDIGGANGESTPLYLYNLQVTSNQITGKFEGLSYTNLSLKGQMTAKSLTFTVSLPNSQPLYFTGSLKVGGDLSGQFTNSATAKQSGSEYGPWNARSFQSLPPPNGPPPPGSAPPPDAPPPDAPPRS